MSKEACFSEGFASAFRKTCLLDYLAPILRGLLFVKGEFSDKLLGKLIEKKDKTKLEKIITTAIYWYGEAYKDKNNDSKYIKLWSAAECFFPTNKNKRTQLNAKNISTLMVCGGYGYITPDEYDNLKRKIVRYYELRSNILHKGEYGHVDSPSLEHFSVIVAYVILTTVSLTCLGYTTIEQALKEIDRLSSNLER